MMQTANTTEYPTVATEEPEGIIPRNLSQRDEAFSYIQNYHYLR